MHASSSLVRVAAAWLLGLTVAIAAAIVTIFLVNAHLYSPQQQVDAYLDALEEGRGGEALGILQATVPAANPAMLDGAELRAAVDGLSNIRIGDAEPVDGRRVTVPVEYTVDGTGLTTTFLLEKVDTEWLFFSEWEFVPSSLPTIDVSVVNDNEAELNGEPVGLSGGAESFAVFYPGEYEATYQSKYFAADPAAITVSTRQDSDASRLTLATEPTDALVADVEASLRQYLDTCAEQDVFYPETSGPCPFYHAENTFIPAGADISWEVVDYPHAQIEAFEGDWVMQPLEGVAVMRTQQLNLLTGAVSPLEAEHEFQFTARLNVSDDGVSVTPVVEY